MKYELDEMMSLIKDYKTGYGGVTDSFMRKELEIFTKDYHAEQCNIADVSKRFDFDKLLQDYRQEFISGGGYVKSDTFESGTEPYEVFEWFKKKLS